MKITNNKSRKVILKLLLESNFLKILNCTENAPTSVQEIIDKTKLPYSSVYKKIQWMVENEILFVKKMKISKKGKKFALYQSKISFINVTYKNGKLFVDVQQ